MEGRFTDLALLRNAVDRCNGVGLVRVELELEGGHYSLLPDDRVVIGADIIQGKMERWIESLCDVINASGEPDTAESTLHCTELFSNAVRETIFQAESGMIHALSRVRAIEEDGTPDEGVAAAALRKIGVRRALILGVLLMVGFSLMAWRTGYVDQMFSHSAEGLALETGPFSDNLAMSVKKSWGNYKLTVMRGNTYPRDAAEFERHRDNENNLSRSAALDILAHGGTIYALLCNAEGSVLESKSLELRPLLRDAKADVEITIRGRITAYKIRLSLERGIPK